MYCMQCGAEIPDGAGYCLACGSKVVMPLAGQTWQEAPQSAAQADPAQRVMHATLTQVSMPGAQRPQAPAAPQMPYAAQQQYGVPGQAPYGAQQQPYAAQQAPYGTQQQYGVPGQMPYQQQPFAAPGQTPSQEAGQSRESFMRTVASKAKSTVSSMADRATSTVNQMAGGEGAVELRFGDFFDAVPKRHEASESDDVFICGTAKTTPPLDKVTTDWPHPWIWSRVLAVLAVTFLGCYVLFRVFGNEKAAPSVIFLGSFMVPFATLVFFYEVNVLRNTSLVETVRMFFMGGVGSLLVLYPVSALLPGGGVYDIGPAMITGLTEEIAKIAIIVVFMHRAKDRNFVLEGLLYGAAVGAGFAAFESSGYAYEAGIQGGIEFMMESIVMRGILSIGGHVAWAAVEGAALASVEGEDGFSFSQLRNPRFITLALIPVVLHGLWDTYVPVIDDIGFFGIPIKYYLLIIAIWVVLAVMLKRGLDQVNSLVAQGKTA